MGTHALIACRNERNDVQVTYCHYDGYLEGAGKSLYDNFDNREDARTITNIGYLSALYDSMDENVDKSLHANTEKPTYYDSIETMLKHIKTDFYVEYVYWFEDEEWHYLDVYSKKSGTLEEYFNC